jgi:hypothetical protein
MKNIFNFFAITIIILFASCNNLNDDTKITSDFYQINYDLNKIQIPYNTNTDHFNENITIPYGATIEIKNNNTTLSDNSEIENFFELHVTSESGLKDMYFFEINYFDTSKITSAIFKTETSEYMGQINETAKTIIFQIPLGDKKGEIFYNTSLYGTTEPTTITGLDYGYNNCFTAKVTSNDRKNFSEYSVTVNYVFSGGTGTADNPFLISKAEQLSHLNNSDILSAGYSFKLTDNINLLNSDFFPIGSSSNIFKGNFDGNFKTLSNLTINKTSDHYCGLFAKIEDSTVKNLILTNLEVTGLDCTAAITGLAKNSTISQCFISGIISGVNFVGGVAGQIENNSFISECAVSGEITGNEYIGGVVGVLSTLSGIDNSYNKATISSVSHCGGIADYTYSDIENCYNTGELTSNSDTAYGISAVLVASINNSFWDTESSSTTTSSGGTGYTTLEMKTATNFSSWDTSIWKISDNNYPTLQWMENL